MILVLFFAVCFISTTQSSTDYCSTHEECNAGNSAVEQFCENLSGVYVCSQCCECKEAANGIGGNCGNCVPDPTGCVVPPDDGACEGQEPKAGGILAYHSLTCQWAFQEGIPCDMNLVYEASKTDVTVPADYTLADECPCSCGQQADAGCFSKPGNPVDSCTCDSSCLNCGYSDSPTEPGQCLMCADGSDTTHVNFDGTGYCNYNPVCENGDLAECCDEDGSCSDGDDKWCCGGSFYCTNNSPAQAEALGGVLCMADGSSSGVFDLFVPTCPLGSDNVDAHCCDYDGDCIDGDDDWCCMSGNEEHFYCSSNSKTYASMKDGIVCPPIVGEDECWVLDDPYGTITRRNLAAKPNKKSDKDSDIEADMELYMNIGSAMAEGTPAEVIFKAWDTWNAFKNPEEEEPEDKTCETSTAINCFYWMSCTECLVAWNNDLPMDDNVNARESCGLWYPKFEKYKGTAGCHANACLGSCGTGDCGTEACWFLFQECEDYIRDNNGLSEFTLSFVLAIILAVAF